jgi:hypothetical protein
MLKKKNLGQFSKLSLSSQKYGFGIRDPRSGIRKKPIPDPGVKKALDPGSGSASLMQTGSSKTLIGWKSGKPTYVLLWDRMEGAWLWTR